MTGKVHVVMLLGDGFGGFGGIAKFNRDFLTALCASPVVGHVLALPRTISEPIEADMPASIAYDRAAAAGKWAYLRRVAACLIRRDDVHVVLCGHRNLLPAACLVARLRGARLVLVIHGVESWQLTRNWLLNWLSGRIDGLISVSRLSAERFCAWSGFPIEEATILPNCVDLGRFRPQAKNEALLQKHALGDGPVIMTAGRIVANERYKGFDEVIGVMPRLLARYPKLKYLIVGDGSDRPRLEAEVNNRGLASSVVFAGRIAEADKVAYYNLADAYVMPSSGEGFGIVLIEALACGVPVVGSGIDGSRDALLGGQLGRLVYPSDSDALTEAIVAALHDGRGEPPAQLDFYSNAEFKKRVLTWAEQLCRN